MRILDTAWPGSDEPEDVAARGQLATLLWVQELIPPEPLWCAATGDDLVMVYENEVEEVQP